MSNRQRGAEGGLPIWLETLIQFLMLERTDAEKANFEDARHRIDLFYTYRVNSGRIDLHQSVASASTKAAKIFGLFPRNGTIQPGSDADLVVYDPTDRGRISARTQQMNLDYNSFEGFEIEGRPHLVTVRGQVAVRDGDLSVIRGAENFFPARQLTSKFRRGSMPR